MEMDYSWHSQMLTDLQAGSIKQEDETELPENLYLSHLSSSSTPAVPLSQAEPDTPFVEDSACIVKTENETFSPSNNDNEGQSGVADMMISVQREMTVILTPELKQPVSLPSVRQRREVNTASKSCIKKVGCTSAKSKYDVIKSELGKSERSHNHIKGVTMRQRRVEEKSKKSVRGKVKSERKTSNHSLMDMEADLGEKLEDGIKGWSHQTHSEKSLIGKKKASRTRMKVKRFVKDKDTRVEEDNTLSQNTVTEDLLDLKVHFVPPASCAATAECSSPVMALTKRTKTRKCRQERPTRRTQSDTSPWRGQAKMDLSPCEVELRGDLLKQWRYIGTEKHLATDLDIAAFLVKHYLETGEQHCPTCCSPLRLLCSECSPLPLSSPPVTPVAASSLPDSAPAPPPLPSPRPLSPPALSPQQAESSDASEVEEDGGGEPSPVLLNQVPKILPRKPRKTSGRGRSHVCPQCGAQFVRSGGLKVHMRIHTGEKPYVCAECSQAFSQSGQLTVHMRKHKGERPFTCAVCPASFPLAGSLKQHMRVHTGDRPYTCPHCSRRFSYAGDLTVHLRKHTGDRPFLCSDCGKSFAVSSDLSKHKKIHSDHRPFKCSVCHKGFPFLNRLTLHMRTHTGDKPFLCADCGSSFSRASNLTVHRRVHHTFEKPFICPVCQHAFADSANLSKHKKNKHGKLNSDPQVTTVAAIPPSPPPSQPTQQFAYSQIPQTSSGPCDDGVGLVRDSRTCVSGDVPGALGTGNGGGLHGGVAMETDGTVEGGVGLRQGMLGVGGAGGEHGGVDSGALFPFYNYYYQHQQQLQQALPVAHQF